MCKRCSLVFWCALALLAAAGGSAREFVRTDIETVRTNFEILLTDGAPPAADLAGIACVLLAPDAPAELVARMAEFTQGGVSSRFSLGQTWFAVPNAGGELTYSFPPDGYFVEGALAGEPDGFNVLHAELNGDFSEFGGQETWKDLFRQVFARWGEFNGIDYTEIGDDSGAWGSNGNENRGDIRIVMKVIDGPGGVLAYNEFPKNGDMVLDVAENWANTSQNFITLRNVVSHEHGHGLGLFHRCPINSSKLMEPFLSASIDGPQHDEIRGVQSKYGDRYEPNSSSGTATDLGQIISTPDGVTTVTIDEVSVRNFSDNDWYEFEITEAGSAVFLTVTPVGFMYEEVDQLSSGACPSSASTTDSSGVGNLRFELFDSTLIPIQTVDNEGAAAGGVGGAESTVRLLDPGGYFVKVSAPGSQAPQMYELEIAHQGATGPALCPADLNGDGVVNAIDLSQFLGAWTQAPAVADLSGNGVVNGQDLALLLGAWGMCPG